MSRQKTGSPTSAEHAYFIGLAGGADPVANWLQAEQELATAASPREEWRFTGAWHA